MRSERGYYLNRLIQKMHHPYIKIITGVRRCGKSYLLKTLFCDYLYTQGVKPEQIILIELDDDRFEALRDKQKLREYVEQKAAGDGQYYIMIDEVQLAKGFEGTIISLNNHPNYDVYITGSNSEFYEAYEGDKHFALNEYLTFGGMPYLMNEPDESEKMRYLTTLIDRTYLTDVAERNHVKLPEELSALFDVLCSTTGSLVNPTGLAGTLAAEKHVRLDRETVYAYMQYMEDAFLFEPARRYNIKGKEYLNTPFKFYPEDVGLRNARIRFRQMDRGFGMETVVYNELRKRGYLVDVGLLETVERTAEGRQVHKQKEVDFIARMASKEYYIQVMDHLPEGQHGENEYDSLRKVPGSFRKLAVINMPFRSYTDENGILIISLEEFLLDQNSLNL